MCAGHGWLKSQHCAVCLLTNLLPMSHHSSLTLAPFTQSHVNVAEDTTGPCKIKTSRGKAARIIRSPCVLRPGGALGSAAYEEAAFPAGMQGTERGGSTGSSDGQPPAKAQRDVPGAHLVAVNSLFPGCWKPHSCFVTAALNRLGGRSVSFCSMMEIVTGMLLQPPSRSQTDEMHGPSA